MRAKFPSENQIRRNFDKAIKDAVESGDSVRTETGLDWETEKAVNKVAAAYPNIDRNAIRQARIELDKQLDGTHELEWATRTLK